MAQQLDSGMADQLFDVLSGKPFSIIDKGTMAAIKGDVCVYVCVCVCMRVEVCGCVYVSRVGLYVFVIACGCVSACVNDWSVCVCARVCV